MPEARQPGGPPEPLSKAHLAVLAATYALHAVAGWGCYSHYQIDTYQSAYVPVALAQGHNLYADVTYYFGPLAVELYGAALQVTGIHLETLYALGLLTIALATIVAEKLLQQLRLPPHPRAAALMLFLTAFAFNNLHSVRLFNWVVPYCHSSTQASLAVLATAWLALRARQSQGATRTRAGIAAGLAASAAALNRPDVGLALIVLSALYLEQATFVVAALVPAGLVYASYASAPGQLFADNLFWAGHNPQNNPHQQAIFGAPANLGPIALLLLLHLAGWRLARQYPRSVPLLALAISALVPAPSILLDIQVLLILLSLARPLSREEAYLGILSLALLARILLKPTLNSYFFYLGPLPMLLLVARAWRQTANHGQRNLILALLLLAAANSTRQNLQSFHHQSLTLSTPRGALHLLPNPASEALSPLLNALREAQVKTLLVLPEGALINVLSGTRHPLATPTLLPHAVQALGEETLRRQIETADPDAVVLMHRPTPEFGKATFGRDYAHTLLTDIEQRYPHTQHFGPPPFQNLDYEGGGATLFRK